MSPVRPLLKVLLPCLVVASGCGGSGGPPASGPTASGASAALSSEAERYFPLEDGHLYHYVTDEAGERGMLVARVRREGPLRGELRLIGAAKRFVFSREGVAYEAGAFVLKPPITVGTRWPGEHGGTTAITSTDARPTVAAGTYSGCVTTVEEGGRPPGARYTTTYCPGVGLVLLDVMLAPGVSARAELKSYGMPVNLEKKD